MFQGKTKAKKKKAKQQQLSHRSTISKRVDPCFNMKIPFSLCSMDSLFELILKLLPASVKVRSNAFEDEVIPCCPNFA